LGILNAVSSAHAEVITTACEKTVTLAKTVTLFFINIFFEVMLRLLRHFDK